MINLLPPSEKKNILYARRNRAVTKWLVVTAMGVIGIVTIITAGFLYINQSAQVFANQIQQTKQQLASQKLEETQKHTEDISNSTKLALQVLSQQILFSELLRQIGAVMPPGSALQSFNVGKLEGGIDLQAVAKTYQTASQVQVNLADPANKIFEKADIINISCASIDEQVQNEEENPYPCQVTIRALFAKGSPFLFTGGGNKR